MLGKNVTETFNMLGTAYGNDCMSKSQRFKRYAALKNGDKTIEDKLRAGRPLTTVTDETIENAL